MLYFYLLHLHLFIKRRICLQLLSLISSKQYEEISITLSIKEFCLNMAALSPCLSFTIAQNLDGVGVCSLCHSCPFFVHFLPFWPLSEASGCPGVPTPNIKMGASYQGRSSPCCSVVSSKRLLLSLGTTVAFLTPARSSPGESSLTPSHGGKAGGSLEGCAPARALTVGNQP